MIQSVGTKNILSSNELTMHSVVLLLSLSSTVEYGSPVSGSDMIPYLSDTIIPMQG